jgi:RHS repeat-associated protein
MNSWVRYSFVLFLLLGALAPRVMSQAPTGTPPFSSTGGGPDAVDLANLNVHITIPMISKPGRGTDFTYAYSYDSSVWYPAGSSWMPAYNWGFRAQTEVATGYASYKTASITNCTDGSGHKTGSELNYNTWIYHDQFGIPHPVDPTAVTQVLTGTCSSYTPSFVLVTKDGAGLTLHAIGNSTSTVTMTKGHVFNVPAGLGTGAASGVDRNGNEITVDGAGHFTDTTGNTVLTVSGTAPSPTTLTYTAPSGAAASYTITYVTYAVKTNFGCSGIGEYGPTNNSLVDRITQPDGSFYKFTYEPTPGFTGDVTGRIASVALPTGGTITYAYSGGSSGNITCADGSTPGMTRVTPDSPTPWTYARTAGTGAAYTTTVTDPERDTNAPAGNVTLIQFQGIYETQRRSYQGLSTGTLLQTTNTCYNGAVSPCTASAITLPISQRDIYVLPGPGTLVSKHTTKYDPTYGMVTEQDDYDFGSGSPSTTLLKQQLITYASLTNGIVSAPQVITVQNASGVKAQTTISYDQTAPAATGAPQHLAVSGSRGNATTITQLVQGATTLTSTNAYFDSGNVQTATDVNGATTTYTYSSSTASCGFAYPTGINEPLSMSRSFTWNCIGGVQTQVKDENTNATNTVYTDTHFWRPEEEDFPDGGVTSWNYISPNITKTTTAMNASQSFGSTILLDGLGRQIQSEVDSDPQGISYTDASFDSQGRPFVAYNPTRCNPPTTNCGEATWGTTATVYDGISRPIYIADADGSATNVSWADNTATLIDEAGKKRLFQFDAIGRLTQVTEAPGVSGFGYITTYGYDVLDDLTSVVDGSNSRSYAYDGLSRLTSETNPESGTVTYAYNTNNDLQTRVDARGITTTYGFDALHRVTGKSYSDGTPPTSYVYDVNNPFLQTATNTTGRLVGIWTGLNPQFAAWTAFSYDKMGRATTQWNCASFPWASICPNVQTTSLQYDSAGDLTQIVYPSGLVVQQSFDGAGRLCAVAGATTSCASATSPWASSFSYNPASQPLAVVYGNGVATTLAFSNRLQQSSVKYSKGASSLFGLNYTFGTATTNNGLITSTTDIVDAGRGATYGYDALNRLNSALTTGSATYSQWGLSWSYDQNGNRTAQSVTAGAAPPNSVSVNASTNRITTAGYGYDASGDMTSDGLNTLAYDAEGRVISASGTLGSGSYNYGGDNLRVHQVATTTGTTNTVYLGSNPIGQYDNQSGTLSEIIYVGSQKIATTGATNNSNRSFESGLTGWTTAGTGVSLVTNATKAHSGSNYIQISTTGSGSVSPPTYAVQPGDQIEFGGWVYLETGTAAAVDWVLNAFDASHTLLTAVVPVPWSVTTPGVWTYETGAYTVPAGTAYITFFGQIYQASGTATARFDDGFIAVGTHYLLNDQLSTRVVTDAGGNVIGQQGHFPYGESWYAQSSTSTWQFTSYQRDTESGNDYGLNRSYINRLARFSVPDPAGLAAVDPSNPQSWNRYAYVQDNPIGQIDPSGLVCNGVNNFMWDPLADGLGMFTPQDCNESGGTWGSTGSSGSSGFLAGGGDPGGGQGPSGGSMPGCTPAADSDNNMTGVSGTPVCPPTGSSGGGGTAVGGKSNQKGKLTDSQSCIPSIFNPSCKKLNCFMFFLEASDAADPFKSLLPAFPPGVGFDDAARALGGAIALNRIVSRGLVQPLSSGLVRTALSLGELSATVIITVPALYQGFKGLRAGYQARKKGACRTIGQSD